MGSKERIQRSKENTRSNILRAALGIVRQEGWHALSMRKLADAIDYTAPVIYEYFNSKESLVRELANLGCLQLTTRIKEAQHKHLAPVEQLRAMWLAYWQFAFEEKELYQIMFGVEMSCSATAGRSEELAALFSTTIRALMTAPTDEQVSTKYFSFWSVVHGLVCINMVHKGESDEINQHVLHDAISGIISSITD